MHVDKTSGGEFCLVIRKSGIEGTLMVIISVPGGVILASNIDNSMARVE